MVKITSLPHHGVQLEVDGYVVPELADLKAEFPVDGLVTITAVTYATAPLDIALESNVQVVIQRHDVVARALLNDLVSAIISGAPTGAPVQHAMNFLAEPDAR